MTLQALSQDLLRVSVRLESLEEQLQSRRTAGVTIEELQKERDMLKKRRDTLDAQLKDNRVLTMEVRKKGTVCLYVMLLNMIMDCTIIDFSFLCVIPRRSIPCSS